ncbi:MAG: hypothetical protein CR217_07675 [Beijerinckiaceae bacterium]|nr:MAG: hypothetical protein CR217_07675 [Beijerinckiaceae bacterium]
MKCAVSRLRTICCWPVPPHPLAGTHGSHRSCLDRLAGDVSLGDGAANDALAADFFDLNEAGFQVLVKSGPGSRLERANLTDGEVSHFKAILNRDERLF